MRQDNNVTDCTSSLYTEKNLNCHNWSDKDWFAMTCRQDNDITDHTSAVDTVIRTELS